MCIRDSDSLVAGASGFFSFINSFVRHVILLESLERIWSEAFELLREVIHYLWQLVPFIHGELNLRHTLRLEHQPAERLLYLAQALAGNLAALDEVALVVVVVTAADEQETLDAGRQRVGYPDQVRAAEAPHGDEPVEGCLLYTSPSP